jgi:hypothetical protein
MAIDRKMRYPMMLVPGVSAPRASGGNPGPSAPGGEPSIGRPARRVGLGRFADGPWHATLPRPAGDRCRSQIARRSDLLAGSGWPGFQARDSLEAAVPRPLVSSTGNLPGRAGRINPPRIVPPRPSTAQGTTTRGASTIKKHERKVPSSRSKAGQPGRAAPVAPDLSARFGPRCLRMCWQFLLGFVALSPSCSRPTGARNRRKTAAVFPWPSLVGHVIAADHVPPVPYSLGSAGGGVGASARGLGSATYSNVPLPSGGPLAQHRVALYAVNL